MNRLKTLSVSFGPDVFRCVLLFLFICDYIMVRWIKNLYDFFAPNAIIFWGGLLLLCDLLYKRSVFKMKNAWILFVILALNAVTVLLYPHNIEGNTRHFITAVVFLLVLCPPGNLVPLKNKYRAIFAFSLIIIIPTTILTLISLWMQVTQYVNYAEPGNWNTWIGHARGYRLLGVYPNPNIAGIFSLISIAFLVVDWTILKELFIGRKAVNTGKVTIVLLALLHMTMITLCASRASRYSLLFFVLIFSFAAFYRYFEGKIAAVFNRSVAAVMTAVVLTGAVYLIDRPIRMGFALMETAYVTYRTVQNDTDSDTGIELTGSIITDAEQFILEERNQIIDADSYARVLLWQLSYEAILEKPVFGVSPRRVAGVLNTTNEKRPPETQLGIEYERLFRNAHNAYIQLILTNGIPVFLLYLLFFILFIKRNLKALFTTYFRSDIFFKAGSLLALCAALAFWNMFEAEMFFSTTPSALVFWSCMSFSEYLLGQHGTYVEPKIIPGNPVR